MTDQTAAIEVWARVLCAADAHVHGYPTWQRLPTAPGRSRDDYRKVAAWLLPRMTVADPAEQAPATDRAGLMRAHVALAEQAGRDQAAIARVRRLHDQLETDTGLASPDDEITRGAAARKIAAALDGWTPPVDAVLPAPADRAAVLREAADALDAYIARYRSPSIANWTGAVAFLRRMAVEAQQDAAHPPYDSWLVELQMDDGHWAVAYPTHDYDKALDRLTRRRTEHPDQQWRLVRETDTFTVVDPKPAVEAPQPTQRNIQCPDAFWRPRPHAPHNWQQAPDTQPVHCPGVAEAQQPKEARS